MTRSTIEMNIANPYPAYARQRNDQPVFQAGKQQWIISRYEDALTLLSDPRCTHWGQDEEQASSLPPVEKAIARTLSYLTPGNEKPFRKMILHQLAASSLRIEESSMLAEAQQIWELHSPTNVLEFVQGFAHPFTFGTIGRIIGLPESLRKELMDTTDIANGEYLSFIPSAYEQKQISSSNFFLQSLQDFIAYKKRKPGKDLASEMIRLSVGEENDFLIPLLLLLFYAGHLNMMNFLGLSIILMDKHPHVQRSFRDQPKMILSAIDELIRYDSPLQYLMLVTKEIIEVGGIKIPAANHLLINVGAANRDPQQFTRPDQIDLNRKPRHLGFGAGAFRCIGARLAQLQAAIGIQSFLEHIPAYKIHHDQIEWRRHPFVQRGPRILNLKIEKQ